MPKYNVVKSKKGCSLCKSTVPDEYMRIVRVCYVVMDKDNRVLGQEFKTLEEAEKFFDKVISDL